MMKVNKIFFLENKYFVPFLEPDVRGIFIL